MTMPGMKPAAKERPEKESPVGTGAEGQFEVCEADAGDVGEDVAGEVEEGEDEGEGDVSLAHMLP